MPKNRRNDIEILLDILKGIVTHPNSHATKLTYSAQLNYLQLRPILSRLNDKGYVNIENTVCKSKKVNRIIVHGLTPKGIAFMKDLEFLVKEIKELMEVS